MEMADPWKVWEDHPSANRLLDGYSQRPTDAPVGRIQVAPATPVDPQTPAPIEAAPVPEGDPTDHAILLALGWVDILWSENSPRGRPTGYKITSAGKDWLRKRDLPPTP